MAMALRSRVTTVGGWLTVRRTTLLTLLAFLLITSAALLVAVPLGLFIGGALLLVLEGLSGAPEQS